MILYWNMSDYISLIFCILGKCTLIKVLSSFYGKGIINWSILYFIFTCFFYIYFYVCCSWYQGWNIWSSRICSILDTN